MNQQCDKVSKLEFEPIQFGVKFAVIHNLHYYVDGVCQQYLQLFIYFETLLFLQIISQFYYDFI